MKLFFLFFILLGIVDAGVDIGGCVSGNKNKFSGATNMNSMSLVFCSSFNGGNGNCVKELEADKDGFYDGDNFPCQFFSGNPKNANKPVIAFFSAVQDDTKIKRFYSQTTEKTGLFLTKTFNTKILKNSKLADLVNAVIPKHSYAAEEANDFNVEPTCHNADPEKDEEIDIQDTSDKSGEVYCKFKVTCSKVKRECDLNANLALRTTTAEFADADDGMTVNVNNNFLFLTKGEIFNIPCDPKDDGNTYAWFADGELEAGKTAQKYEHNHNGKDTIIQCQVTSSDGVITHTTIWNIFTVAGVPSAEIDPEDARVTNNKPATFDCETNLGADTFPSPLRMWFWLEDKDGAEEIQERVTLANPTKFFPHYVENMTYKKSGNFKCYLYNGVGDKSLAKDWKTVYIVETEVKNFNATPINWFEYNVITTPPEAYYVKGDPVKLSCFITKEAKYSIWWRLDNEYFQRQVNDDGTEVLKKLKESGDLTLSEDSAFVAVTNGWTISQENVPDTLGHESKQVLDLKNYKSDMTEDTETSATAICFLVDTDLVKTSAELKKVIEADDTDPKMLKTLKIRVFDHVTKPVVKGPLNQIQSEKAGKDIIMNCKTNGLPPSYIYFIFRNNKTEGVNLTDELSKSKGEKTQFTRYEIDRDSDVLTTLTIHKPNEDDEGKFTCYAVNRAAKEDHVAGPDADVFIEERCSEGAQFCFKNAAISKIKNLWLLVLGPIMYKR